MTCPTHGELVQVALDDVAAPAERTRLEEHIRRCATCGHTVASLRSLASTVRRSSRAELEDAGPCLDDHAIASVADGTIGAEERTAAVHHLVACASCRHQLADVCSALADTSIASEIARITPRVPVRRPVGRLAWIGGLAAAAMLVFAVRSNVWRDRSAVAPFRDETVTVSAASTIVAPLGAVDAAPVFRWTRVRQADLYKITVFDAEGVVIWETQTRDTTAAISNQSVLRHNTPYFWKVEARTDFDRWVSSGLAEFRVAGKGGTR